IRHPKFYLSLFKKRQLYNAFNKFISHKEINGNYVVLFLHYQPERTSMPEAGFFSQQWLIIKLLSISLPENWRLLVKEHPSTFTGRYDFRYRHPKFYSDISTLKNVELISIETDTFKLIDN